MDACSGRDQNDRMHMGQRRADSGGRLSTASSGASGYLVGWGSIVLLGATFGCLVIS